MSYKVEILSVAWEDLKQIEDWYLISHSGYTYGIYQIVLLRPLYHAGC